MKVYIAGAITNNPRYKERFEEAEKRLISMCHAVINQVCLSSTPRKCWQEKW